MLVVVNPHSDLDWVWGLKQIRQPTRGFRKVAIIEELVRLSLTEDDKPGCLARQRRIEQLTREYPTRVRQHDKDFVEFAALRLMYRESIREFEIFAVLIEVARPEGILKTGLG